MKLLFDQKIRMFGDYGGGGVGVHGRVLPKLTVENRPQTQIKKNSAKIQLGFNVPSD